MKKRHAQPLEVPLRREMSFEYGVASGVVPGVVRLVAENPGPFTFKGTNTYLVGSKSLAVVDPGPADESHCRAILDAAQGRPITHILITHAHRDHVDGLAALQAETGAQSVGFGRSQLVAPEALNSPSGKDFVALDFAPDLAVGDGDLIEGEDWMLEALHTPGHAPDHLCFALTGRGVVFSGDHVMSWNTTVIAPPEGRMAHYLCSLSRLLDTDSDLYLPGHGGRLEEARRTVKAFLLHRQWREQAVLGAIRKKGATVREMVAMIYRDLDEKLLAAAGLSIMAHVEHLREQGAVNYADPLGFDTPLMVAG
ncbi:MAG: MBL fold metallo-hydrolase [Alphaproteobacteria bacterium BRH_c36]|nr:MAG: MBL fold metallo-hydrolase [Alphaproteobacteria bacterium BRH_c36]